MNTNKKVKINFCYKKSNSIDYKSERHEDVGKLFIQLCYMLLL